MCVVSFPNILAISLHDLNPGLQLTNPGIIERSQNLSCPRNFINELPEPDLTIYGLLYITFGLGVRHQPGRPFGRPVGSSDLHGRRIQSQNLTNQNSA